MASTTTNAPPQNSVPLPRRSTSTTRRPLLAPSTTSLASGTTTPRAPSPQPAPQQFRGFPSESAYLAFLHAWAEEKKYIHYDTGLRGFYGEKTVEEYASQSRPGAEVNFNLGLGRGVRAKWRARKDRRRETVA